MKILILHDAPGPRARADEHDSLVQAQAVVEGLKSLGHAATVLGVGPDLDASRRAIASADADLVFNLVESLGGEGRFIHVIPSLLDAMDLAYTGASADAMYQTSNKLAAKRRMREAGIATPRWIEGGREAIRPDTADDAIVGGLGRAGVRERWIVKSVWEHASIGLDDASIIDSEDARDILEAIEARRPSLGGEAFAEVYIEGREFNVALLAGNKSEGTQYGEANGPQVLPIAEILFPGYDDARPRIVGYRAKWSPGSFEYENTPRRFDFDHADESLLSALAAISLRCWRLFGLQGHARVDFRVDAAGRAWVLEVNANPCLSPDAGFAAALERARIPFARAIERIVDDVPRGSVRHEP